MEELKLRAWLTEDKIMLPVKSISFHDGHMDVMFSPDKRVKKVNQEVKVMRAVGFKDIYGNDVYEGDLLASPFPKEGLFELCLDTTAGVYTKQLISGHIQFLGEPESLEELVEMKVELSHYVEIKGNIYENKDLLGE